MKNRDPFVRGFAGVLLGFVMFGSLMMSGFMVLLLVPAPSLYEANSFKPKPVTSAGLFLLALVPALIAGFLCRHVAQRRKPVIVLVAILGLLSLYQMAFTLTIPVEKKARTGEEDRAATLDAMKAEEPIWLTIGVPAAIVAGVLIGGRFRSAS
jgi:hypothetical protein